MEINDDNIFNKPIWEWALEDVLKFLIMEFNFEEEILKYFVFHEISGLDLIDLTEDNLKYDLKIVKISQRKKVLRSILDKFKNSFTRENDQNGLKTNHTTGIKETENNIIKDNDSKSHHARDGKIKCNPPFSNNSNNNESRENKVVISLQYILDENLKKMKFLCFKSNKVESIIEEFTENLNYKNNNFKISKKAYNLSLCDENGNLIPKDTPIMEIINSEKQENVFYINKSIFSNHFVNDKIKNNKNATQKTQPNTYRERKNSKGIYNLGNLENYSVEKINKMTSIHNDDKESCKEESLHEEDAINLQNPKLKKFLNINNNTTFFNSKSLNNQYTSAFKDKINKFSENNNNSNTSLMETALKNNYLSFENLDNLEKKIYKFIDNNNTNDRNSLEKMDSNSNNVNPKSNNNNTNQNEKVTINSFYNISNLNNFNNKSILHSLNNIKTNYMDISNKANNALKQNDSSVDSGQRFDSINADELSKNIVNEQKFLPNDYYGKTKISPKKKKHIFNLNLGKIIDGNKIKNEILNKEKIKYNEIHSYEEESNEDSDLNYSKDSNKNKSSHNYRSNKELKKNDKNINSNNSNNNNFFENLNSVKKSRNGKADDSINPRLLEIKSNQSNKKFKKFEELSEEDLQVDINLKKTAMHHKQNKNKIDNKENIEHKEEAHIIANFNYDSQHAEKSYNNNKNNIEKIKNSNALESMKNKSETLNQENYASKNNITNNFSNMPNNNYIKIEENPSIKKPRQEENQGRNKENNKKPIDGEFCNYGEDVKNTKKSLYDAIFKNLEKENSSNKMNSPYLNNKQNLNYNQIKDNSKQYNFNVNFNNGSEDDNNNKENNHIYKNSQYNPNLRDHNTSNNYNNCNADRALNTHREYYSNKIYANLFQQSNKKSSMIHNQVNNNIQQGSLNNQIYFTQEYDREGNFTSRNDKNRLDFSSCYNVITSNK